MNARLLALLCCPDCGAAWADGPCRACGRRAPAGGELLDCLGDDAPVGAGATVGAFYDERPFPGYGAGDDALTLLDRCAAVPFARALDDAIPAAATVLDLGCGTAQLAAFLALRGRRRLVVGCDLSRGALAAALAFRRRAGIDNLELARADLFRTPLRRLAFDWVVCRGVVHHTADPFAAIAAAAAFVAPGGRLVLGWYDRFGRAVHRVRSRCARWRGRPIDVLDPVLRRTDLAPEKRAAWIADQYRHPVETSLGLGAVLRTAAGSHRIPFLSEYDAGLVRKQIASLAANADEP